MKQTPTYISHSSFEAWKSCQEKYYLRYVEKLKSIVRGSSLDFGSAMDNAINFCLEAHQNNDLENLLERAYDVFCNDPKKGWLRLFDDLNLRFLSSDFDTSFFSDEDLELLGVWEKELGVNTSEVYVSFKDRKNKEQTEIQLKFSNRVCWKSLLIRAKYMISELVYNVLPQIEKVHLFQHKISGSIPLPSVNGESQEMSSVGYLDAVLSLKGYDKPIVIDFKTASSPYDSDAVFNSQQLALYMTPTAEEFDTDLAGFIVLHKSLSYDAKCSKCGHKKTSQARSCDNEVKGNRCKGAWEKEYKATSQILVDKISKERQNQIMTSYVNFAQVVPLNIRIQNWNACFDYGFKCDFYEVCHKGDTSQVVVNDRKK
ncbi:MAG: PD-(D/E)XK nuclease family protein [Flavobacteriales bacterium]|nr:PD-(D/E)XK nuclease family protein [Flavobacteriales bacterium]